MGVTSRKHDYWKLFGFMRHQIKFQTNGSPRHALGSGFLQESHLLAYKSFHLLHFTQYFITNFNSCLNINTNS